ncbi:alpha/beta hydrolase [Phytohabitans rumicis]|uniref:Peptidase S33 tripeptidyl aminopeptidase-like C-terminal domain-containing protein n=1 Tax=Phytohabitans rumicis TaxID=1076125 RepID=A0A6V8LPG8_9ACTN|nr:alpha/beta hydrolase [Phytohabitans rumicis]GFJ96116.1 hypothetical protein Prum_097580 [Phytohabitans rumicis]
MTWLVQGMPPWVPGGAPQVAARFDLVAIDPRFHGRSTPLECGWPTATAQSAAWVGPDRRSFEVSVARNRDLASRCAGQAALLPYASTRNVARDLDAVRAALGEPAVSFVGWSWGSYLGAVYAQLFPGRVDRLVLDSAVNPDTYGPDASGADWPAQMAEQRNWARWAAGHDDRYHLGGTTAQALASLDVIRRAADRGRTLRVGRHRLDPNAIRRIVLGTDTEQMYAQWGHLMRLFYDAARGVPVTPTAEQDAMFDWVSSTEVAAGASAFAASLCADRAARSRDPEVYYRDIQAHRAAEPMYGPANRNVTSCTFWPTEPAEPPTTIGTTVPALIVGATGDPTTPYAGQLVMRRAMAGARLVTLRGAYRHGVYLFDGDACVDGAVNRYLLDGALPPADITCARTSPKP